MNILLLTVFLSIMQTAPPVPRQAANNPNQTSNKAQKDTQHKQPVAPTPSPEKIVDKTASKEIPANNPASPNTEQTVRVRELPSVSVSRGWADWALWIGNALLVVAAFVGICVAVQTLKALKIQAVIMRRQTRHIARQALSMRRQTTHLKNSVEAAKEGILAAKASADAAIASERAWVMVDLDKVPGVGFLTYGPGLDAKGIHHEAGVRVSCICSNQGKTPAKILEKRAALIFVTPDNPLPLTPNLDIEIEDPVPHYLQPGGEPHKRDWRLDTQYSIYGDGGDMLTFFVVYGIVKYRHLFSEQIVHTTFGYRIRVDSVLERLIDYPKYNENT